MSPVLPSQLKPSTGSHGPCPQQATKAAPTWPQPPLQASLHTAALRLFARGPPFLDCQGPGSQLPSAASCSGLSLVRPDAAPLSRAPRLCPEQRLLTHGELPGHRLLGLHRTHLGPADGDPSSLPPGARGTQWQHQLPVLFTIWPPELSAVQASGSWDKTIHIWKPTTSSLLIQLKGHVTWVKSIAFSPDELWLASAGYSRMVKVWDCNTGKCLETLKGVLDVAHTCAFTPDGKILVSGAADQTRRQISRTSRSPRDPQT
ncbi:WD repeat-containing protein 38 isoform X3 [Symphalangus syndactylus]|uniref:WD repeat-containing protein 38 isoform X3 n=1 Tax=Symphalangus syndactylus TaxID=9590 RepID=UPI002441C3CF|nr:WD repeat-containing protein 38 isoform X3 [Symphalangus syndactylus]